jgi:beta-glucosidase
VTDEVAGATPFLKQLRGFGRIRLEPGESRQVEFALGFEELSCWNARMERVVEPGWFTVQIGGTSAEGRTARFAVTDAGSLPAGDQPAATPEITRADDMEAPE